MTRRALALQHTRPACGDAGAKAAVGRRVSDAGGRVPDVSALERVCGIEGNARDAADVSLILGAARC